LLHTSLKNSCCVGDWRLKLITWLLFSIGSST
jgi:hypothetical protein